MYGTKILSNKYVLTVVDYRPQKPKQRCQIIPFIIPLPEELAKLLSSTAVKHAWLILLIRCNFTIILFLCFYITPYNTRYDYIYLIMFLPRTLSQKNTIGKGRYIFYNKYLLHHPQIHLMSILLVAI